MKTSGVELSLILKVIFIGCCDILEVQSGYFIYLILSCRQPLLLYTSAQSTFRKVLYKFDYSRLSEFVNKKIYTVNCFKMFIVETFY